MQGFKENHKKPKRDKDKTKDENYLEKKFRNRLEAVQYETDQKKTKGMTEEEEKEQKKMTEMFEKKMMKAKGTDSKDERESANQRISSQIEQARSKTKKFCRPELNYDLQRDPAIYFYV